MTILGIYGVSTKSGKSYLADFSSMGIGVYGYARTSKHGTETVDTLLRQQGIYLERPPNNIEPASRFVPLRQNQVGHDLDRLVGDSDLILIAHPATYHEETAAELKEAGLLKRKVPLVLSPSRTLATPYLWEMLGEQYPVICFGTCPYSCKSFSPGTTYIKRRKRAWFASVEGEVPYETLADLKSIFPQMLITGTPAATSLGNIGAVFHPAAYLLNREAILSREAEDRTYSFYVEGIVNRPEVAEKIEELDQVRLRVAHAVGCSVFGLREDPRERTWTTIMEKVVSCASCCTADLKESRLQRAVWLKPIHNSVVSAQHWLDYTYGTRRIPGEPLADAISRTATFTERSYPQERYIHEDVPTGLVPLESLARRLGLPCGSVTEIIDLYEEVTGIDARKTGRNLEPFDTEYLIRYLSGKLRARAADPCKKTAF